MIHSNEKIINNCKIRDNIVVGFIDEFLPKIEIPEGIIEIGESAFSKYYGLEEVKFPISLKKIGDHAFYKCTSLVSLYGSPELEEIGDHSFAYCNMLERAILEGTKTKTIGPCAFTGCCRLTYVSLPGSLIKIESGAFMKCQALTEIKLPDGIKVLEECFISTGEIEDFYIPDSLIHIEDLSCSKIDNLYLSAKQCKRFKELLPLKAKIHIAPCFKCKANNDGLTILSYFGSNKNIEIPEAIEDIPVTEIGCGAFEDSIIETVKMPMTLKRIGYSAFANSQLISVRIPHSVTEVGELCFFDCKQLKYIHMSENVFEIPHAMCSGCSSLTKIEGLSHVKKIDDSAFSNCNSLSMITLPDSLKYIGDFAFWNCNSLFCMDLPALVQHIGKGAFSHIAPEPLHVLVGYWNDQITIDSFSCANDFIFYCIDGEGPQNNQEGYLIRDFDDWPGFDEDEDD